MTLTEYLVAVEKFCPDLGSYETNCDHMDMGITTEIAEVVDHCKKKLAYGKEFDLVELGKELGDICWYCVNRIRITEGPLIDKECLTIKNLTPQSIYRTFEDYTSDVMNENLLIHIVKTIAVSLGLDFYEILDKNIAKLTARYPNGFTKKDALNRNIDNENKATE